MRNGSVVGTHTFGRFRLNTDGVRFDVEEFRHSLLYFFGERRNFGSGENQGGIEIDDSVARVTDLLERFFHEHTGVGSFPSSISRREERADVAGGNCA